MAGNPGESLPEKAGEMNRRVQIRIQGIVQGVGFRPHIFKLAQHYRLHGGVRNQADGVEIEASGQASDVEQFIQSALDQAPPLARIVTWDVKELPYESAPTFRILESSEDQPHTTLISPDVCLCNDCLAELRDPLDRRFRYPFTNCTNCGPRYSIIQDIPYDRCKTTMAAFSMCPACQREYDDPLDRRFHAQPNACWQCGPQIWLETPQGSILARKDEAILRAIEALSRGAIVAIKGLGGFHLAVLATDEPAVRRLRNRKIREEKPFAVMFDNLATIETYCQVSEEESRLLASFERPIVLMERRTGRAAPMVPLASGVAPRNRLLGAFLPYTPLHYLLFEQADFNALVMTSGNRCDEPIVTRNAVARSQLSGIADFFLLHDREIHMRCDDSVVRFVNQAPRQIRRSRGYVPAPIFLSEGFPAVLGVGAELKSTVCITRHRQAFLSQHIGDLENLETLQCFEHSIEHLQRILHIEPELVVHDLHPDYQSTQWALSQTSKLRLAVQHHHAHIAAVLAERQLEGPILGLALDGTGYGTDGTIWGGELLRVDGDQCERLGHLRQVPLPGGNAAAREPWRMAVSNLWGLYQQRLEVESADFLARWPERNRRIVIQMLRQQLNAPPTSSCGRLFDAVAALIGVRDHNVYEGQAAVELEQLLEPDDRAYTGSIAKTNGTWILDPAPILLQIIRDVRAGVSRALISARFHNGLVQLLADAVVRVGGETGLERVALSGGVFQNAYLSTRLENLLASLGWEVFSHREVPANDACIALGQAYVGAHWWWRRHGRR
jgi:hydrogenase maturation protein HypF